MINNYNTANTPYAALKTSYESSCTTYKKAYEQTKLTLKQEYALYKSDLNFWVIFLSTLGVKSKWDIRSTDSLPKKPWRLPVRPAEYKEFTYKATPTKTDEVTTTDHLGGWGYRTMGILDPSGEYYKTYGVHGIGPGKAADKKTNGV